MPLNPRGIIVVEAKEKACKKLFKWTRELVRLALNDGWTQQEIAEKCRTQQSIVSNWKNGSRLGTEQQLKPLLEIYGHKLRRNTFKVYWSIKNETMEKIFYRVEGKVIFAQAFFNPIRDNQGNLRRRIPELKLTIHHQGAEKFIVVIQSRLRFSQTFEYLENSIEDAIWGSSILEKTNSQELIRFVDEYADEQLANYPSDANTLPFLIRQALLNHGLPVDGVVEFPAPW